MVTINFQFSSEKTVVRILLGVFCIKMQIITFQGELGIRLALVYYLFHFFFLEVREEKQRSYENKIKNTQ